MRLHLLVAIMDVLTLIAIPLVFILEKLRRFQKNGP